MTTTTSRREFSIETRAEQLAALRDFVRTTLGAAGVGAAAARLMALAVDEAATSIVAEAADTGRHGRITVELDIDDVRIKANIADTCREFCLSDTNPAEIQAAVDRSKRHELGIFLMRAICDEISYSYKRGFQNDLELVKFLY